MSGIQPKVIRQEKKKEKMMTGKTINQNWPTIHLDDIAGR